MFLVVCYVFRYRIKHKNVLKRIFYLIWSLAVAIIMNDIHKNVIKVRIRIS